MKQYTTPDQTAKLIEMGFNEPKTKLPFEVANDELGYTYAIGELIEMLPKVIDCNCDAYNLQIEAGSNWKVYYVENGIIEDNCDSFELIDALYNMIVKLRKEGII